MEEELQREKQCPEFQIGVSFLFVFTRNRKRSRKVQLDGSFLWYFSWGKKKRQLFKLGGKTKLSQLIFLFMLSFLVTPLGTEPDIRLPWHLPRKGPDAGGGLHGGDAGQVHGGRKAEAETRPQERRGHWVVWTMKRSADGEFSSRMCAWVLHWEQYVLI